jgi:hypothetical protein
MMDRPRWLIERYHYVLKSGCRLEQLQLETSDSEASKATSQIVFTGLWLPTQLWLGACCGLPI